MRLDVAVPGDEVRRQMERAAASLGREVRGARLPAGKAPAEVIVQMSAAMPVQEMLKAALGGWYPEAVSEAGVVLIDDPELDLEEVPEDGELTFKATVQVRPKAALGGYTGLEVGRAEPQVPEEALDQQLQALRERAARLVPVERPARTGDFLVIDFDGLSNGKRLRNASARDYLVGACKAWRASSTPPGRHVGGRVGRVPRRLRRIRPPRRAARQDRRLHGIVKQVQEKELPEPRRRSRDRRERVRHPRRVARRRPAAAGRGGRGRGGRFFRRMVIDAAVANASVDVPAVMVDRRIGTILQQTAQQLLEGVDFEYSPRPAAASSRSSRKLRPDAENAIRRAGGGGRRRRRGHRGLRRGGRGAGARRRRGHRPRARPAPPRDLRQAGAGRRCARTCG